MGEGRERGGGRSLRSRLERGPAPYHCLRESFRSPGAAGGRVLPPPACPPQPPRHCLGSFSCPRCAGLLRRVGGRRCGEEERWEGQAGQSPVSGRRDRPRPWESLTAQTEGK
ncbi:hypothetical protein J1605_016001 [Eschrichtius robustus]|uniref:Uncharacterized protein n=1 Tax=Eschrichtius robustus TaxID=9764 RepID=A0AB34G851_ESCRO|nr:hypothetical protein J1605_016001 [Eschrichtius robustus]